MTQRAILLVVAHRLQLLVSQGQNVQVISAELSRGRQTWSAVFGAGTYQVKTMYNLDNCSSGWVPHSACIGIGLSELEFIIQTLYWTLCISRIKISDTDRECR